MARKTQKLPDYFTAEEAETLVAAAPSYPIRMAFLIMLRTGLRVSEALSLRRSDLRLNQDPPVLSVRPEASGSKARKGLTDLTSFHSNDRNRPMLDITRQWVGASMKRAAAAAGIDPARAHPHAFRHTHGLNCVLRGVPLTVLQHWLGHQSLADTQHYVEMAGTHHSWVAKL